MLEAPGRRNSVLQPNCFAATAPFTSKRGATSILRSLLVRTFFLVAFLRAALYLLSFVRLKEYLARRAAHHPIRQSIQIAELVWAVRTTAAYIPGTSCLTQALAAKYQLERSGRRSRIHIGVAKDNGQFLAHAWLECEGKTVLGGGGDGYARLITVD
jgi:hypothetical protein